MDSFISYDGLPIKSGGAHKINRYTPIETYSIINNFLDRFGNNNKPLIFELEIEKPKFSTFWRFSKIFGVPNWRINSFLGEGKNCWYWRVSKISIEKAFEVLESTDFQIILSVKWHFQFTELNNKKELIGQNEIPVIDERNHNSQIYLRIEEKTTVSVWFTLPFTSLMDSNLEYVKSFSKFLPFQISKNHWKLWTLSKNGNWHSKSLEIML